MRRIALLTVPLLVGAACGGATTTPQDRPTTTPLSAPAPSPAVVSGSGLEGYGRITLPTRDDGVQDLAVAPDGRVWVVRSDGSVARSMVDKTVGFGGVLTGEWKTYTPADGLPFGPISAVEVAPDGTVWAGGARGLARLDGETWTAVAAPDRVRGLAIAPDGSVVTLFDDLVARFDGETWTTLKDRGTIPESYLTHTALDASPVDGTLWVGTGFWGGIGGVSRFDGSAWTTWAVPAGLIGSNQGAAAMTVAPDGSVWVMLGATLTHLLGGGRWALFPLPIPREADSPNTSMAAGPDGTIWISRSDGLLLSFNGSSWTKDRLGGSNLSTVVEVLPDGTLWVGEDDSLLRLTPLPR